MIILNIIFFVASLLMVIKSADWFLNASEKVGEYLRLPRFIMGVILVGFGTSLPELATGIAAVSSGQYEIVSSNIIGSNIANILIIIGISTVVMGTIKVTKNLVDIDLPLLVTVTALFILLMIDGELSRLDGSILLAGFAGYIVYSLFYKDDDNYHRGIVRLLRTIFINKKGTKQESSRTKPSAATFIMLIVSIILLSLFSKIAIDNLLAIVSGIGIAVSVISFFALAIGTSLPELVVSIKALRQKQGDLVIGNIIGSSIFNLLLIGGVSAVIAPQYLSIQPIGIWMLGGLGLSALLLFFSGTSQRFHIWEGATFILIYVALSMQILRLS